MALRFRKIGLPFVVDTCVFFDHVPWNKPAPRLWTPFPALSFFCPSEWKIHKAKTGKDPGGDPAKGTVSRAP